MLPVYFCDNSWLVQQSSTHSYSTRSHNFKIPKVKHKFAENCLRYNLPHLLNETPTIVKEKVDTHSEIGFSIYAKKYFLLRYSEHCHLIGCYICSNV